MLLIGGGGFIGRNLANACVAAGMVVRVADATGSDDLQKDRNIEFMKGDYCDPEFLRCIIESVDFVVHLAHDAMLLNIDCNMSIEIERNILPTIHLMDVCSASHISKFLFVSSGGTVYGNCTVRAPISEDATTHPVSVYGTTKLMIENIGFLYHIQKNLPFIVARPGNAYGQGQLPFRGQGFIATALASAECARPLSVFGDGSVVRDYIHVIDIANALVALLLYGRIGEAYNVGTASGTSLRALIDDFITPIVSTEGRTLECIYETERLADVDYNVLSNAKLKSDTGFFPRISLDKGLGEAWEWIKINASEIEKGQ